MPKFASLFLPAVLALTLSAEASAEAVKHTFFLAGNVAGAAVARTEPDGTLVYDFEFNDRGRGSKTTSRIRLDERGYPASLDVTGHDYWKSPVEERFRRTGARASWSNSSEKGETQVQGPAFYLSLNSAPQETELLAKALLASPDGRISLLPAGEARIEKITTAQAKAGERSREVHLYAVSGLGFTPAYVWLDKDRNLFAGIYGWAVVILEGWEDAVPALTQVQEGVAGKRYRDLAAKLARKPKGGGIAFRNARLFDAETGAVRPGTTVVVSGNRIQAVGPDAEVKVPEGIEVVDVGGKALLPGLWDMHTHLGDDDGMFHLQAGVTTVRDLANDIDKLEELRREWEAGVKVGPRVLMAGFIDGPGPYAGPTKVLVDTEEEALQAVDRYAELGYVQVKLYSSLDTKLVAPIIKRAHQKGMRVSGHIPNGMSAEQAVRAGYDEIQHANFLVLNFLDPKIDTRTPARFTEVGEQAAGLDLASERVKGFLALLKERGTVLDPTLVAFEGMLTGKAGELDPSLAAVADRFPPQARRGLYSGGLNPPGEKAQRYRDSYRKMVDLVGAAHKAGVTIVPGTDAPAGFAFHRELELYAQAGIPTPDILRLATLGAARVMKKDKELGSIAPGKLADLFLVDGDPAARISDIRRVVLTVKDGVVFDPAAINRAVGMKPVE
ncbi:MAG TPA: amidohydrolase family protein [Thermoanaerobaculia bacterium]|nr:amidohydrolase family protein [Thermoanaerobaculia bacterium]